MKSILFSIALLIAVVLVLGYVEEGHSLSSEKDQPKPKLSFQITDIQKVESTTSSLTVTVTTVNLAADSNMLGYGLVITMNVPHSLKGVANFLRESSWVSIKDFCNITYERYRPDERTFMKFIGLGKNPIGTFSVTVKDKKGELSLPEPLLIRAQLFAFDGTQLVEKSETFEKQISYK